MERFIYLQHINHNMSLLDSLLGIIAPHECLNCGIEGSLLCHDCANKLPPALPELSPNSHLSSLRSATLYQGLAKDLIWKLKSDGAQAAAKIMARCMAPIISKNRDLLIVPVPTATSRTRQRGYDQAKLLSKALSRQTGLPRANCLARLGQAHQVGSHRKERLRQLEGALIPKQSSLIKNSTIILVDDVTTTGATLETAAKILKQAGAAKVEAVTFAYAAPKQR